MIAPLNFLKVSFILLTSLIITACHSDGPSKPATPDINTLNIYTFEQEIFSFNESTSKSAKRGEFDAGENQFLELNIDETKQGYEYAVYVFENSIYLLNYDKDSNAKTIELASLSSQTICGLVPHKTASQVSFSDNTASNRSTLDLPIITIEYQKDGETCNPELNTRDTLDFTSVIENDSNTRDVKKSQGRSENVLGGNVFDYSSSTNQLDDNIDSDTDSDNSSNNDSNTEVMNGSVGFLGRKVLNGMTAALVFDYSNDGIKGQWEKPLSPTSNIKTVKQVSSDHVVVQDANKLFLLNVPKLFSINNEVSTVPVQNRIDALFSQPFLVLDTDTPVESNTTQNNDTFLIKQENTLYFFESGSFKNIPSNEAAAAQNALKSKFDLTSDNNALVIQESGNLKTLVAISGSTGLSTTILSAEEIEFTIINNDFYVNTLELEQGAGWQAHRFTKSNNNFTRKTFNNSRLLFINNLQEKLNSIYILSSNSEMSARNMVKPALYKFDPAQKNGRMKSASANSGSVDFSFGQLNTNVSDITNSIIVNDMYGRISLKGVNEDSGAGRSVEEYYYFDPSQSIANPSLDEQTLTLIKRVFL